MVGSSFLMRYLLASCVALLVNLGAQRFVFLVEFGNFTFYLAVLVGTVLGVLVKYLLDVYLVFQMRARSPLDVSQGARYLGVSVLTTLIFWASESIGWWLTRDHSVREAFAATGLVLGYTIKYYLDRRLVFVG